MTARVLGLDLSTKAFAYARLSVRCTVDGVACPPAVVDHGLLHADAKRPAADRLWDLYDQLRTKIATWDSSYGLVVIAVEEPNYPRNAVTQRLLVKAVTLAEVAARQRGVRCVTIHHTAWKQHLSPDLRVGTQGNRQAQKDRARAAVTACFPTLPEDISQDEVDAIGVALYLEASLHEQAITTTTPAATSRRPRRRVA